MNRISRNLSIILRSERLIAQRHLAVLTRRAGVMAAAGLVAGLGLIMLNVAGYLALAEQTSKPLAALIVALADMVLAGALILLAGQSNVEAETAPAVELRDLALSDLEAEMQGMLSDARQVARDPLGLIAPGLVAAIARAVIKALKT